MTLSGVDGLDVSDPGFAHDLAESNDTVWLVARWLQGRGHSVEIPPIRLRPTPEQMAEYADDGDLFIRQRIEVKRRRLSFTSREDYPYATLIVDVAHAWDRAEPKPYAYIITNQQATHAAFVLGATYPTWRKVQRQDRAKGRARTFYEAPLESASFLAFAPELDDEPW